jgi:hypothetical protein
MLVGLGGTLAASLLLSLVLAWLGLRQLVNGLSIKSSRSQKNV